MGVYWPVYWSDDDGGDQHLAFVDNEETAKTVVKMLEVVKVQAAVHPPVHLRTFDTFLKGWA
jgi:hypothetical protein